MATEIFAYPFDLAGHPGSQDSTAWRPLVLASGRFPFRIFKKDIFIKAKQHTHCLRGHASSSPCRPNFLSVPLIYSILSCMKIFFFLFESANIQTLELSTQFGVHLFSACPPAPQPPPCFLIIPCDRTPLSFFKLAFSQVQREKECLSPGGNKGQRQGCSSYSRSDFTCFHLADS